MIQSGLVGGVFEVRCAFELSKVNGCFYTAPTVSRPKILINDVLWQ